ncbi:Tubulin Hypothetical protein cofactor A [Nesidiocoris tenuis]|uniref:Tubulin-specific chaperone A n=1 Tax=Nesidiocoris tenuis TaxID=355587 RepID=A0ABN7A7N2_9HEMI|nr:Tubulin Hypothetical protein cofactor A [Nesidiocoris tenuis]
MLPNTCSGIMADPRIRTITIQTGVVRRLTKEKISYEKEAEDQAAKVAKYKEEGKEEAYIKKQEEVLRETTLMIGHCRQRLRKVYDDFSSILKSESDLAETEVYLNAQQVLKDAEPHLDTTPHA